jgi:hypothetical protein
MSVKRQGNFLGQMRLDVPDLRSIESSVTNDFDDLAGRAISGKLPLVVKGLTLSTDGAVGQKATSLQLNVAGSVILHYTASESGTVFTIDDNVAAETLNQTNSNILGYFVNSARNYIGLDLYRNADSATIDSKQFLDPGSSSEFSQDVPLARTLRYKIVISTQNFSSATNVLPIAIVSVDGSGNVVDVTDARRMLLGLSSGGDSPSIVNKYPWGNRTAVSPTYTGSGSSPFSTEEKNFSSFKGWMDAIMTSLWEIRGGDSWFSNQNRDNVKLAYGIPVLANGDNLWFINGLSVTNTDVSKTGYITTVTLNNHPFVNGSLFYITYNVADAASFTSGVYQITYINPNSFSFTEPISVGGPASPTVSPTIDKTLAWTGLNVLFENSGDNNIYYNTITSWSTVIEDKYCLYIDLDRSQNTSVVPTTAAIANIASSTIPGRRIILAWRSGNYVYSRDRAYEVGRTFAAATTLAMGHVKLSRASATPASPPVISDGGGDISTNDASASFKSLSITHTGVGAGSNAFYAESVTSAINGKTTSATASDFGVQGWTTGAGYGLFGKSTGAGAAIGASGKVDFSQALSNVILTIQQNTVDGGEAAYLVSANTAFIKPTLTVGNTSTGIGASIIKVGSSSNPALLVQAPTNNDALRIYNGDIKLSGLSAESRIMYTGNTGTDAYTVPTKYIHLHASDAFFVAGEFTEALGTLDDAVVPAGSGHVLIFKIPAPQGSTITNIQIYYSITNTVSSTITVNCSSYLFTAGASSRTSALIPLSTDSFGASGGTLVASYREDIFGTASVVVPTDGYIKTFMQIIAPNSNDHAKISIHGLRVTCTMQQLTGVMN